MKTYQVGRNDSGRRLDRIIRKMHPRARLDEVYAALRHGHIRIDGARRVAGYRVVDGQTLTVSGRLASLSGDRPDGERSAPGDLAATIVFESQDILVLNKPVGIRVHGYDSLANRVAGYLRPRIQGSLSFVPGPVHRLDRNTSGLIIFAASLEGAKSMSELFRERQVHKTYLALVSGKLCQSVTWQDRLERNPQTRTTVPASADSGRNAITHVQPLASQGGQTLVRVTPETGLTHQIRAHASIHGHALSGDPRYGDGGDPTPEGYLLHAHRLALPDNALVHPGLHLVASLPRSHQNRLEGIFGESALNRALDGA